MPYLTEQQLIDLPASRIAGMEALEGELKISHSPDERFDVFLSHSNINREAVSKLYAILQGAGFHVYVDWIIDGDLNRAAVTAATAKRLRQRLLNSSCLLYVATSESRQSRWMPWELGYMDGHRHGRCAVIPVNTSLNTIRQRLEYLEVYNTVVADEIPFDEPNSLLNNLFFEPPYSDDVEDLALKTTGRPGLKDWLTYVCSAKTTAF